VLSDNCIFCGAERPEGVEWPPEHWIPDWVSRAVIGPNQAIEHHSTDGRVWYAPVFEFTVGRICPKCNHHWMSNIETRASRLARPLVQGETPAALLIQEQEALAKWCYLKVISLEAFSAGREGGWPRRARRGQPTTIRSTGQCGSGLLSRPQVGSPGVPEPAASAPACPGTPWLWGF
jgi:hypothetical protein